MSHGYPSVAERATLVATFRFVEVRLMEVAAAWTPSTPEMEVKMMLGRHIWDFAQHADALGKRSFELRQSLHHSLPPSQAFALALEGLLAAQGTAARLDALYEDFLPALARQYEAHRSRTDPVLDEPTLVIVDRVLSDIARQRAEAARVRERLRLPAASGGARARALEPASIVAGV